MPYIIAILALVIIGAGFTLFQNKQSTPAVTLEETAVTAPATEETVAPSVVLYKDGTYTTKTTYQTPKRDEYTMDVSLTFANNVVTGATVAYSNGAEKDPNAAKFEAAYKAEVIGKSVDTISLSRVGGASLTTTAFNNALANIKTQAKS